MERDQFIQLISGKMKLVRTEQGFSQDKMAEMLGISKKTLVQIEKGRTNANWTTVIAFCALFNDSELLLSVIGDKPVYLIRLIANNSEDAPKDKTMGGMFWWKEIKERGNFRLQQNVISHHYRILDESNYRRFSSFEKEEAMKRLDELNS
ncbi:helix-turn-helix transcriptional regulator [Ureibacillus sinduriensis]|uniref:XRE family transcriptional regulator n=1 Tax=Ureibacillus sinduriensis BLB-1 = JCM 15800 TaxID=1384057 RepID=A0A0A3IN33_9BACL|nr:helix-turn-helix transcriptional regulator [Ureibacillus sinduriensis]KGR76242.1 XRE family transcriptional regulator [Ureibacillus sinduriensis BLB-1 = JCM 15800]